MHWAGGSITGRETNGQPLGSERQHGILERARKIVGVPTQLGSEGYYPEGVEPSYKRGRPAGISMRVTRGVRSVGWLAGPGGCMLHAWTAGGRNAGGEAMVRRACACK